jgi:hypothetical protein
VFLDAPFSVNAPNDEGLRANNPYVYIKLEYAGVPKPTIDCLQMFSFDTANGFVTAASSLDDLTHISVTPLDSESVVIVADNFPYQNETNPVG